MKKFSLHIILFSLVVILSILGIFSLADGTTDAMYLKFTTPKQSSLILGGSRAAQGLQPKAINPILKVNNIYNFSFQLPSSPYGEVYLESIKKKIDPNETNGIYILDVNPWSISEVIEDDGSVFFSEENNFLDNTQFVSLNPNFEYLIESFGDKYAHIVRNKNRKGQYQTFFVEDDGWLNVTIESDMISTENRTINKIKTYRKKLEKFKGLSVYRKNYLIETIKFLKQYGKVYLVRIPVIDDMLNVENDLIPNFNNILQEIGTSNKVPYINMMLLNSKYSYTDGNHLDKSSGNQFSIDLAKKIKTLQIDQ